MGDMSIRSKALGLPAVNPGQAEEGKKAARDTFGAILGKMIKDVDGLQREANAAIAKAQHDKSTSLHEVMIAMEKADISFRTMLQVRNKLLEAYQEIMRLQV